MACFYICPNETPKPEQLEKFLDGDSVSASASVVAQVGVVNSAGGAAVEMGIGDPVQVSAQFQHNWQLGNLPVRW